MPARPRPPHDRGDHADPPKTLGTAQHTCQVRRNPAWRDVVKGALAHPLWLRREFDGTRGRLRRTVFHSTMPFFNRALAIGLMGLLFGGRRLAIDLGTYLPHLAVGILVWMFLRSLLLAGCTPLRSGRDARTDPAARAPAPVSVRAYRNLCRALIGFAANAALVGLLLAFLGVRPGWAALAALPGLALLGLIGLWAGLLLGSVAARFRRLKLMLRPALRIAFIATPVLWTADWIPEYAFLVEFNPFFHLVEVVRGPLLGNPPPAASWLLVAAIAVAGSWAALPVFARHLESAAART